jgi:2-polyprenyl-6-methoxyphenol hydroxylase-like FAD-dependent oxidoreductase
MVGEQNVRVPFSADGSRIGSKYMGEPPTTSPQIIQTGCCIVGGGPAGMMLGFLLARAGVEATVLEKHADFLRDFRGDTIHPSTLELMHELGLLRDFLARRHQEATELTGWIGNEEIKIADFTRLPTHCHFIAFMPQWDFLNFLAERGARYPTFHLRVQTAAADLIVEDDRVGGVRATSPGGPIEIRAPLVVAADGRHSTIRQRAGLEVIDLGAPIDVLWMRLSRRPTDRRNPLGRFDRGRVIVMLDRGDFWQCAFVIAKGGFDAIRERGLEAFRADIAELLPFLADRVGELQTWDDIRTLTVAVDRLRRWHRPGLLAIGDAAHAMSPIGGVGINLAIQDAVATANILYRPLMNPSQNRRGLSPFFRSPRRKIGDCPLLPSGFLRGTKDGGLSTRDLEKVQRRREFPTRVTQALQVFIQNRVLTRVLSTRHTLAPPWPLRLLNHIPFLPRLPARLIGLGIRPEHIQTPDAFGAGPSME